MSLIDLIEKLINEHGSFKEHLELLREQISILEKENTALKSENAILKGKEDTTESTLNKATKKLTNEETPIDKSIKQTTKLTIQSPEYQMSKCF